MTTIQQARRITPPTVTEMLHLIDSAEKCFVAAPLQTSSSSPPPHLSTFHPGAMFPSSQLAALLQALGFLVLASEPLDDIIHTLEAASSQSFVRRSGSGGFSLRVLYDWLPTCARLDAQVPGARPRTSFISDVELGVLQKKLPTDRSAESQKRRAEMFVAFDPNGNGFLSLAEIDKGARDVLQLHNLFDCKPVLMRAFQAARKSDPPSERNHQGDYVTKRTFRLLLWYLKEYFNLWQIFCRADESGDRRVSKEEFVAILPELVKHNLVASDESRNADALFAEADLDGGGMLLFDEFSAWALARGALLVEGDADE